MSTRVHTSLGESFDDTTPTAPSAAMGEIAPALVPVCCICRLIRDKTGSVHELDRWVTRWMYREIHGVDPNELALTHTYCPNCFLKARETMQQYFREIETST